MSILKERKSWRGKTLADLIRNFTWTGLTSSKSQIFHNSKENGRQKARMQQGIKQTQLGLLQVRPGTSAFLEHLSNPAHHRLSTLRLSCVQGKAAQEEAARLAAAVAEEQRNVRAALQALEAERARLTALAEAEKARLQKQVRTAAATFESDQNAYIYKTVQAPEHGGRTASRCK